MIIPPGFAVSHLRGFTVKSLSEVTLDGTEKDAFTGLILALSALFLVTLLTGPRTCVAKV